MARGGWRLRHRGGLRRTRQRTGVCLLKRPPRSSPCPGSFFPQGRPTADYRLTAIRHTTGTRSTSQPLHHLTQPPQCHRHRRPLSRAGDEGGAAAASCATAGRLLLLDAGGGALLYGAPGCPHKDSGDDDEGEEEDEDDELDGEEEEDGEEKDGEGSGLGSSENAGSGFLAELDGLVPTTAASSSSEPRKRAGSDSSRALALASLLAAQGGYEVVRAARYHLICGPVPVHGPGVGDQGSKGQ